MTNICCGFLSVLLLLACNCPATAQTDSETVFYDGTALDYVPQPVLLQASDGNFYGDAVVSSSGEEFIFQLTPYGKFTELYRFPSGVAVSSLIQGTDRALYGTAMYNGSSSIGSIFTLTLDGVYTQLYSFDDASPGSGSFPSSLFEDVDGNFDVTAISSSTDGTALFQFSPSALTLTPVHTFGLQTRTLNVPPVQASNGVLYGTSAYDSAEDPEPYLYSLSSEAYRVLFQSSELDEPYNFLTPLIQGSDNFLYGIAQTPIVARGASADTSNALFRINFAGTAGGSISQLPSGQKTLAVTFSPLTAGSDGNLYGYYVGGANAEVEPHFYRAPLGGGPIQQLVEHPDLAVSSTNPMLQGADGAFYFVYSSQIVRVGNPSGKPPSLPAPIQIVVSPSIVSPGSAATLSWKTPGAASDTDKLCFASGAWAGAVASSGSETAIASTPGDYDYALTCGGRQTSIAHLTVAGAQAATITALILSPASGSVGSFLQLSAQVSPKSSSPGIPTGSVSFSIAGNTFATIPLVNGKAEQNSFNTAAFPAGPVSITATYNGSAAFAGSSSLIKSITLTGVPQFAFTVTPTTVGQNQPITFQVTVEAENGGITPTGSIYFVDPVGNASTVPLVNGVATLTTTASATQAGELWESFEYYGDSIYSAREEQIPYFVLPQASISLSVTPTQAVAGQTVAATAAVQKGKSSTVPATGNVRFFAGSQYVGVATLSNGIASFASATIGVPAGTYQLTGSYVGDANNGPVTSTPVAVTIVAQ